MTAYQVLPGLTPEEYADLRDDIAANGVRVPVDVDENGQVLDGHHRSLIAAELGIDCPRRAVPGLSEADKIAHALAVNVHRRSLTREQRRELLAVSIKAEPEASDREHARRTGTSDKTAGVVRDDLERRAEIPHVATRTDSAGRQQPASKPAIVTNTATTREQFLADRDTGEVLSPEDWKAQQDVHDYIENSGDLQQARLKANFHRLAAQAGAGLPLLDPDETAAVLDADSWQQVLRLRRRLNDWFDSLDAARPRSLRAVKG